VWADDLGDVPDYDPVFPPEQESTWTWDGERQAWYLHHFKDFEPDLNTDHPGVREEMRNMIEYWIRLGVRGFRVDGAPFFGQKRADNPDTVHEVLLEIHAWANEIDEETILIPEADLPPKQLAPYAGNGDAQMLFNFFGCANLFLALATGRAEPLQWAANAPNGGFSDADPDDLVTPVLTDGPFGVEQVNVACQRADEESFLHWMRRLIGVRKQAHRWLTKANPQVEIPAEPVLVLAHPGADGRSLVAVHNLADAVATLTFDIGANDIVPRFTGGARVPRDGASVELQPYGYAWWEQRGVPQLSLAGSDGEHA
jgi:glycosidase